MQEILYIIALSIGSLITLFILTKIMGYRQMSQLSMFDYINGITIGSIAAEMATSLEDNFVQPLIAMIVYALFSTLLSLLSDKSIIARRFIEGTPLILLDNDIIYENNLKKSRVDIDELLEQCRVSGYFDLSKIQTAILESNGRISFLPKVSTRPISPEDLNLLPEQDTLVANLIIDGCVMERNLKHFGKDIHWLENQIKKEGFHKIEDVFLATCDMHNHFHAYKRNNQKEDKSLLT